MAAAPGGSTAYTPLIAKDLMTGQKKEVKEWSGSTLTKEQRADRFKKKQPKVEPEAKTIWIGIPNVCKNSEDKNKLEAQLRMI